MSIRSIFKLVKDEILKPRSFKTGEEFEKYVREILFPKEHYTLVEMTHSYATNKNDYVEASLKPDFTFRDHITKKEFYVEAKVRTTLFNNKIAWCNKRQLERYNEYDKTKPVFLIMDLGEDESPYLALIPLKKAQYTGLIVSYTKKFEIEKDKAVTSKNLWNR